MYSIDESFNTKSQDDVTLPLTYDFSGKNTNSRSLMVPRICPVSPRKMLKSFKEAQADKYFISS